MRVLVTVEGLWPPAINMAGMSIIYKLQKELRQLGVDIHVLTAIRSWTASNWEKWFVEEEERTGIHFHGVDVSHWDRKPLLPFLVSKKAFFRKVGELHSKYRFDIVHDYSSAPVLIRLTGAYKKRLEVSTLHTLCTYNTGVLGSFRLVGGFDSVDRIICVTEHMRQQLTRFGCPESKVVHLPLGVDVAKFAGKQDAGGLRSTLGIERDRLVVLYVGPLEERKGVFTFAEAAKLALNDCPETVFVIATYGQGGVDRYHNRHKMRLLETIEGYEGAFRLLEGLQDVPLLMAMADVFVLPQTTPHGTLGYPLVLLEALAAKKAIVASDTAGVNELIVDGQNGLLFQPGDSDDLAHKLTAVLASEDMRRHMSHDLHSGEIRDVGQTAEELLGIYDSAITNARQSQVAVLKRYSVEHVQFYQNELRGMAETALKISNNRGRLLDIGCGDGAFLYSLESRFESTAMTSQSVIGVDLSEERCRIAQFRLRRAELVVADTLRLPFADNSFGMANSSMVIEHVHSDKTMLENIRRVLKHDGELLISTVVNRGYGIWIYRKHRRFALDPTHEREYRSGSEFIALLREHGFTVDRYNVELIRYPVLELVVRLLIKSRLVHPTPELREGFLHNKLLTVLRRSTIPIVGFYRIEVLCSLRKGETPCS